MKLHKTGIAGLDEFLQGGLPPRVFLLLGTPGSGNEIFARQVAYFKARHGEVAYFTVNKTPESIKDDMSAYGWDVSPLEEAGSWRFINLTQANSLLNVITREIKQNRCVVVDSLSELLLTHKIEEVTPVLNSMSTQNTEYKELHLVLLTEGMQDPKVETTIQHFVDGVIIFTATWGAEALSRSIMIKKMTGTVIPTRRLPYSIGKRGFTIETAIRIT